MKWTDSSKRQGRDGDVEAPEINWTLVWFLLCISVAVVALIAGWALYGGPFIGGVVFGAVCAVVLACFAMQGAAPW